MAATGGEIGHIMPRQSSSGESSFDLIPLTPINTSRGKAGISSGWGSKLSFNYPNRISWQC